MRSFDRIMLAAIFASGWIETGTGIGSGAMLRPGRLVLAKLSCNYSIVEHS